jgi:hypothetical protein
MSNKTILLSTASPSALLSAIPTYVPQGWYGEIDAGFHSIGDVYDHP